MKNGNTILRTVLRFAGLGFTIYLLFHLILIFVYDVVHIMEPNRFILVSEIITLIVISILYVFDIRKGDLR